MCFARISCVEAPSSKGTSVTPLYRQGSLASQPCGAVRSVCVPGQATHPSGARLSRALGLEASCAGFLLCLPLHGLVSLLMLAVDSPGAISGHFESEKQGLSPLATPSTGLPHALLPSSLREGRLHPFTTLPFPSKRRPLGLGVLPPGGHRPSGQSGVAATGLADGKGAPLCLYGVCCLPAGWSTFAGGRTAGLQRMPPRRHGSFMSRPESAAKWVRVLVLPLLRRETLG